MAAVFKNDYGIPGFLLSSGFSHCACLVIGISLVPFLKYIIYSPRRGRKYDTSQNSVYNLDQARLNIELPPPTMWMNMGYWKDSNDLPRACEALLQEVLKTGGLLNENGSAISVAKACKIRMVDLGFGCGDQSVYLTQRLLQKFPSRGPSKTIPTEEKLLDSYIGITLDSGQFNYAYQRLVSDGLLDEPRINIFCADAGKPAAWNEKLTRTVKGVHESNPSEPNPSVHEVVPEEVNCWVLALDTLFHFSPSRLPILTYAKRELDASVLAYDLLLADRTPFLSRLGLMIIARFMGCPYGAFKTEREYRGLYLQAGYAEENIELRDISEHVFRPLSSFLAEREKALEMFGWRLGKLKAAKWLFEWWARSGIIRGVIVVARK
ncbi:hypothetical protein B7463_g11372, partial [Scytalidium lignicola]